MKEKTNKRKILLAALLLAAAAGALLFLYREGVFLPRWTQWQQRDIMAVLRDRSSADVYTEFGFGETVESVRTETGGVQAGTGKTVQVRVVLKNRAVRIFDGSEEIFRSRRGWKVSDVLAGDLDGDGLEEIIFLLWKRGSYGTSHPFWEKNDIRHFSQHIFIYTMVNGEIVPWWCSSAIGEKAAEISLKERTDAAGQAIRLTRPDGSASVWAWGGFGLFKTEAEPGEETFETGSPAPAESRVVRFLAAGDNLISDTIYNAAYDAASNTFDFSGLYKPIQKEIQTYDLAAVNEETILVHDPEQRSSFPFFGTPDVIGDDLHDAGFNIITSANNHAFDKGVTGISDTIRFWQKYPDAVLLGIHASLQDSEQINYVEKNGIRFALFNYSAGTGRAVLPADQAYRIDLLDRKEKLIQDLCTAEKNADFSIVFLHMGTEYRETPTEEQKETARELTAAGADLIIGTHPHCVEPMETVTAGSGRTSVVYYSLGNLVSAQMEPNTVLGGLAEVVIVKTNDGTSIQSAELIPTVCHMQSPAERGGSPVIAAYLLSDYTDELAGQHFFNQAGQTVSLPVLRELWERVSGQKTVSSER